MNPAPMFQQLAALPAVNVTVAGVAWAGGGAALVMGLLLWLTGSRFSQGLVTLAAVAVGAYVGKKLPGWMGWGVDPIGTAFGGALVLGVVGYVYHRMWVGVGLGLLVAGWAAVGTWAIMGGGEAWVWPTVVAWDVTAIGQALWGSVPVELRTVMPWTVGGAGMAGMTLAAIKPRVAGRMFYSMLGLSVVVTAGVLMHQMNWLRRLLPGHAYVQLGVMAGLVAVGMTVQWWLAPRRVAVAESPAEPVVESDE
jgi:hypothetical protein